MFSVEIQYVPGGAFFPYASGYADLGAAQSDADLIASIGFWYQRPDDATIHETPQPINAARTVQS